MAVHLDLHGIRRVALSLEDYVNVHRVETQGHIVLEVLCSPSMTQTLATVVPQPLQIDIVVKVLAGVGVIRVYLRPFVILLVEDVRGGGR